MLTTVPSQKPAEVPSYNILNHKMKISLAEVKIIAEIFQAFCIGIGALVAGFAGWIGLNEWREKQASIKRVEAVQKKYPIELIGKELVIGHTKNSGHWYLIDKRSKTSHHIKNYGTLSALDWGIHCKILDDNFKVKFPPKESIFATQD